MPRRPLVTPEQVQEEFSRLKQSGLKLLSAYPAKSDYYYWRRLFTDLGLCGRQSREDRLVRARRYCVQWRLKNKDKLKSIREQKSETLRQARQELKAKKLEECRQACMTMKTPTKKEKPNKPAPLTASSALVSTRIRQSRKSASLKKADTTSAGPSPPLPSSTSPPSEP